jgi:serine/threonine-protein kinase RsbW
MSNTEQIVLTFPGKADYVSLARLTTSGVASRCGFDMDAIEDLKVCVSEILNKIIALGGDADGGMIRLAFSSTASALTILLGAPQITASATRPFVWSRHSGRMTSDDTQNAGTGTE